MIQPGSKLAHYEIVSALGRGGMGEVWRAKDTKLGREVAIKVLPEQFSRDAERIARMEREARMLAALNHPNIAAIHGLEESDDARFLVLELVEGDTLGDRLKHGPIPIEKSLRIALQIGEAVEAAHGKGVIHRDLKPANIKITPEGRVKVLDFGLAKAFIGDQGDVNLSNSPTLSMAATQAGIILGTAAYMSPEQASGEVADHRTDVWAFGVVLFEMLTGRPLFTGKTASHVMGAVLNVEPAWERLPSNLHPRLRVLLERMLEKEPKDRLSGISDARVEIQKVLADQGRAVVGPSMAGRSKRTTSVLPWVAAVVMATLAGLAAWTLKPAEPQSVIRWDHALPDGTDFRNTDRPVVAISPDGGRFVYNGSGGLYLRSMAEREARLIPGTEPIVTNPVFSPDGEWLAFWSSEDGRVKKIPVVGGTAVSLTPPDGDPFGISWDAEDTIFFTLPTGVWSVSADGGEPDLRIAPGEEPFGAYAQLLPGAEALLTSTLAGSVAVYSLDSGRSEVLFPGTRPRYLETGHIVYAQDNVLFAVAFDIDRLEVTGGPVPLVEGLQTGPAQYAVSASGTLVYAVGGAAGEVPGVLAWVDRSGTWESLPVPPRLYRQPRLSPDGTRVAVYTEAVGGESDIWVYDLDGRSQIRLLAGEGNNSRPIWTPDSRRLAFTSDRDGTERIWWQLADGSAPAEPLTEGEEGLPHWPDAWSPDGNILLFTKYAGGGGEQTVWTLSLDDGAEAQFVAGGPGGDQAGGGDFSPDGRWMAYRSNTTNPPHVQLQPFPTNGSVYPILSEDGGSYPMWSRDGAELFYRRSAGVNAVAASEQVLAAVDISTDASPRFTNERVLPIRGFQVFFGNRDYDISRDGERFMMILPEAQADTGAPSRPQINVVVNWHQELLERVPVD